MSLLCGYNETPHLAVRLLDLFISTKSCVIEVSTFIGLFHLSYNGSSYALSPNNAIPTFYPFVTFHTFIFGQVIQLGIVSSIAVWDYC
jgi:hypothetical protein